MTPLLALLLPAAPVAVAAGFGTLRARFDAVSRRLEARHGARLARVPCAVASRQAHVPGWHRARFGGMLDVHEHAAVLRELPRVVIPREADDLALGTAEVRTPWWIPTEPVHVLRGDGWMIVLDMRDRPEDVEVLREWVEAPPLAQLQGGYRGQPKANAGHRGGAAGGQGPDRLRPLTSV